MDRAAAVRLLDALHEAQNEFYGGGDSTRLRALLTEDVTWTVPGKNRIAGTYIGVGQVFAYFARRRDQASATFRMRRVDVLVGGTNRVAALTDGLAVLGGVERQWSTVGLYTLCGERIDACTLLPLDPVAFDDIWS
jgi:ketosteroid isomerase-like protein